MKVLVIGASGFIGQKLMQELSPYHSVVGTYSTRKQPGLRKLDITEKLSVERFISKHRPNLLIHCAALTDVDLCERDQELAYKVNIAGTEHILDAYKGRIIYLSTGFVFDGAKGNYTEDDRPRPICYYGYTKRESEQLIGNSGNRHIIARFDVPYGHIKNHVKFVNWALDKLREGKPIRAVRDQVRSPTLIDDIARVLMKLSARDLSGIFHVAGPQVLSSYEMALKLAEHFSLSKKLIKPVMASSFRWDAMRPKNLGLITEKLRTNGLTMSSFDKGLEILKKQMGDVE